MGLLDAHLEEESRIILANFGGWILDVGNGIVSAIKLDDEVEDPSWIRILENLLLKIDKDHIQCFASTIHFDFSFNYEDPEYLKERDMIIPKKMKL